MPKNIIQLNEEVVKNELKELVRNSVEETLNELLNQEAEELTSAAKYERTETRRGYRSGHYSRKLTTTSGEVRLEIPKLKGVSFETAIIERYRRRESSVEEALIEMYLAGVSVRRVEDISEALWGSRVSASTISDLNQKAYVHIEEWRNRKLSGKYPYIYVDGIYLKRNWGGEFENVSILVAIGVDEDGYLEIIGAAEGMKEDAESWKNFLVWLKGRGLDGVKLVVGDKCLGMCNAVAEVFPKAKYQRCIVHFYRNIFSVTPGKHMREVTRMLKAIHAQENKESARKKARDVVEKLRSMRLNEAAKKVKDGEKPIVHSDRGCHYRWPGWIDRMEYTGLTRSMSEKGCSPDNAACEGFFGHLNNEMFYNRSWQGVSTKEFIAILNNYLIWYREKRIKLSLGGLSPMEYRRSLGLI